MINTSSCDIVSKYLLKKSTNTRKYFPDLNLYILTAGWSSNCNCKVGGNRKEQKTKRSCVNVFTKLALVCWSNGHIKKSVGTYFIIMKCHCVKYHHLFLLFLRACFRITSTTSTTKSQPPRLVRLWLANLYFFILYTSVLLLWKRWHNSFDSYIYFFLEKLLKIKTIRNKTSQICAQSQELPL